MSKFGFVPNSFQTPNGYVDDVMAYLTGEEIKVLIYATRRILGFQKRQDRISISQFTDGTKNKDGDVLDCGTGLGNGTVKKCLANLVLFGLMIRVESNDPATNEGVLWGLQWDESLVNFDALEERATKKAEVNAKRMVKARSVRQPHPPSQTPPSGTERTPPSGTERTPPSGTETQKTVETQGNTFTLFGNLVSEVNALPFCDYPDDIREMCFEFCKLYHFEAPNKPKGKSKTQFSFWVASLTELVSASGKFGVDALREQRRDFEGYMGSHGGVAPFTISSPQSLVNAVRGKAAQMRGSLKVSVPAPVPDMSDWEKVYS